MGFFIAGLIYLVILTTMAFCFPLPLHWKFAARPCDPNVCKLPDCMCSGTAIPHQLKRNEIPQIVLLTFDDSVTPMNYEDYFEIFSNRYNPNGAKISATFFVSHDNTDYFSVRKLYEQGHEIALHSITHRRTGTTRNIENPELWREEIVDHRFLISHFSVIPIQDIKGFRAPFLQMGGDGMFTVMKEAGLEYEFSRPTANQNLWPYTADYASTQECPISPCQQGSYPGIWIIPTLNFKSKHGHSCAMVDSCLPTPIGEEETFELLRDNFLRQYNGNKAPMAVPLHSSWLLTHGHKLGYIKFLDYLGTLPDVYILGISQAIDWIKDPATLNQIENPRYARSESLFTDCPERKTCMYEHAESGTEGYEQRFVSCLPCPSEYPYYGNPYGKGPREYTNKYDPAYNDVNYEPWETETPMNESEEYSLWYEEETTTESSFENSKQDYDYIDPEVSHVEDAKISEVFTPESVDHNEITTAKNPGVLKLEVPEVLLIEPKTLASTEPEPLIPEPELQTRFEPQPLPIVLEDLTTLKLAPLGTTEPTQLTPQEPKPLVIPPITTTDSKPQSLEIAESKPITAQLQHLQINIQQDLHSASPEIIQSEPHEDARLQSLSTSTEAEHFASAELHQLAEPETTTEFKPESIPIVEVEHESQLTSNLDSSITQTHEPLTSHQIESAAVQNLDNKFLTYEFESQASQPELVLQITPEPFQPALAINQVPSSGTELLLPLGSEVLTDQFVTQDASTKPETLEESAENQLESGPSPELPKHAEPAEVSEELSRDMATTLNSLISIIPELERVTPGISQESSVDLLPVQLSITHSTLQEISEYPEKSQAHLEHDPEYPKMQIPVEVIQSIQTTTDTILPLVQTTLRTPEIGTISSEQVQNQTNPLQKKWEDQQDWEANSRDYNSGWQWIPKDYSNIDWDHYNYDHDDVIGDQRKSTTPMVTFTSENKSTEPPILRSLEIEQNIQLVRPTRKISEKEEPKELSDKFQPIMSPETTTSTMKIKSQTEPWDNYYGAWNGDTGEDYEYVPSDWGFDTGEWDGDIGSWNTSYT